MSSRAVPKTKADVAMGMRHLQKTIDLERSKAADHHRAANAAKKGSKAYDYAYQSKHAASHDDDVKKRKKLLKAYKKMQKKLQKARES
jgi:hypothetical protein